jgi:hypothetical protein
VAHLQVAYAAALEGRYLWHEFGDLHLLLPECSQCEWARRARRARQTG